MTRRGYGGWRTTCVGQRRCGRVLGLWQGRRRRRRRQSGEREAWLVEASVFARRLQDIEDGCLGCVRRVLQAEGWPARSWQQDGLLVEDEGGRQLRGGGGGDEAKARLEAAMRKAEAEVGRTQDMEVSLLAKSFFEAPVWRPCCSGWPVPAAGGPRWRRRER